MFKLAIWCVRYWLWDLGQQSTLQEPCSWVVEISCHPIRYVQFVHQHILYWVEHRRKYFSPFNDASSICSISGLPYFQVKLACATVFGICQALLLIHMMHDACHSAIGYSQGWWQVIGRLPMDFLTGGDMKHWHHQHVLGHHIYTNVMGEYPVSYKILISQVLTLIFPNWSKVTWDTSSQDKPGSPCTNTNGFTCPCSTVGLIQRIVLLIRTLAGLALKVRIQNWTTTYMTLMNGPIRVNPISTGEWAYFIFSRLFNFTYGYS